MSIFRKPSDLELRAFEYKVSDSEKQLSFLYLYVYGLISSNFLTTISLPFEFKYQFSEIHPLHYYKGTGKRLLK